MAGLDFDIDPFKGSDPLKGLSFGGPGGGAGARQRPAFRRPLGEADFRSVGQQALDAGSSGVSHVLGVLDKPGQAARGVLAGKGLGSLKHLVPFSDTMGLTTAKDHTSGRDLTNSYGLTDRHDKGWGAWGAGLAADIATDPLTYTTFGAKHALTGMGKAVEKTGALKGFTGKQMIQGFHGVEPTMLAAGQTASDVTHAIDKGQKIATGAAAATGIEAGKPLSSLVRIGLPFGGPGVNIGTGKTSQKIAGALDSAGDYVKFGNPVGRAVGSLFDSTRHGATGKATQIGAQRYLEPELKTGLSAARFDSNDLLRELVPLVKDGTHTERAIHDAARATAEGVSAVHGFDPSLQAAVQSAAAHVHDVHARQLAEAKAAGAPIKDAADPFVDYVHRSALPESSSALQLGGKGGRPQALLPTTSGANIGREEVFRGFPGGTVRLNDWFDRYSGIATRGQPAITARAIKKDMVADHLATGGTMTQALGKVFDAKAEALAQRIKVANPNYRSIAATATDDAVQGRPFFSPDLASDFSQRARSHAHTQANTKAAIGILSDMARPMVPGSNMIPVHTAMKKLGLMTTAADTAAGTPMEGALVQMWKGLAKQGAGKVDPFLNGKTKALRNAVNRFAITPEHFKELAEAHAKWTAPNEISSSLGAFDSVTNAFKALAYPIWLPSHVRNAATAGVNNLRHGVGWRDYLDQLQVMTGRGSRDLSAIHPSLAGLNPAQQAEELRRLQYGHANIFGGHGMNEEIAGNVNDALTNGQRFTPEIPGSDRVGPHGNLAADTADLLFKQGLAGSVRATGQTAANLVRDPMSVAPWNLGSGRVSDAFAPLGIKGVGGAAKDALPAVSAGRKAGTNIEDLVRGALFNKLSRGGASGQAAADAINKLHFDYDASSAFEKNVMRRAFPFYTYMRKNLPLQLDTMVHQPGILQAQSKPFNQADPDGKGYVPKYMDSGFAMGIGPEKDGQRQYVSKLGLPAEEAFEKLHFRDGMPDFRRTALSYMGGMNPLVKAPLEQLFNTQFHTQRALSDLHAPQAASALGRLWNDDNPQVLSQIMANSPMTRFVSSADKLLDPRKSWAQKAMNLASGVKVTDVNTDKQRAIDTRQALQEMMAAHPNLSRYSSFYVKPEDAANLTPEEIELMRAYTTQQAEAKEFAKAQRIGIRP